MSLASPAALGPSQKGPDVASNSQLFAELWISLASLLSSYTAVHGLSSNSQATVDLGDDRISVLHAGRRLDLERQDAIVAWIRENGESGTLELTVEGRLRGPAGEQEIDMAAEAWARELMHDHMPNRTREPLRETTR